ncbi:TonB-dependent receptor [Brevundimonas subvibrioides]|uniref:TonB-dependent receptor n=1 Tax=Brevundimonas subvibrioides TaxID=74313 RepID=UPI0022B47D07|nr:TonB-dependent receptor [Brevundimonas subvibrioides]
MRIRSNTRSRLMAGCAAGVVALLAMGTVAQAQTAPQDDETQVDEVVVTGIRASIANSIAAKRRETSIVEVVTAEDIGKLPDQSITESLARLPGLAAQRLDGRAQVISVRGLGPDFTTALLNGREQVTTGDNRGVEFDQFPSELLASVVVYKTPDATLVGQGLAGTVDLRTIRPLEYGRKALALNYRYEWNDLGSLVAGAEDTGNRYSVSFVDQFLDDTLGVALGYAHLESPYQNERYNAWGYPTIDCGSDVVCVDPDGAGPLPRAPRPGYSEEIGQLVLGGAKPYAQSGLLERDGYMGVLEWRPNDRVKVVGDAFYSEFNNTQVLRGIEMPLWWGASNGVQEVLQPVTTIEDGLITSATFNNVDGVIRNDLNTRDASTLALGLNASLELNDRWTISADLSHSKVERTDQVIESYSGTGYNAAGANSTVRYTIDERGVAQFDITGVNYADPNVIRLTDPRGWGGSRVQAGYLNSPNTDDELNAVRVNLAGDVDFGAISSVEIGVNVSSREKTFVADEFFLQPAGGATSVAIPSACLLQPTTIEFLGFSMISYDTACVLDSGVLVAQRNPNFDVVSKNWEVTEDITNLFFQANIEQNLGPVLMTGNIGFQYLKVEQTGSGFATSSASSTLVAINDGDDYADFLPSLNLIFQLTDSDVLRLAAAKVQARPRMDQMRGSQNFSYNPTNINSTNINSAYFGGSGGNPKLRPWEANVYDISYEHYFGPGAYISIAGFYKDLTSYVFNQKIAFDFTGFPVPGAQPASFLGLYNSPQNGEGGAIQGIEIAASIPFGEFFEPLDGFGLIASYSDTSSEIQPDPGNPARPIEGLSERVSNVTLYYEKDGFQARVSNRFRSDFLGEVAGFGNGLTYRAVGEESVVDAQLGYEFQSGPLDGLSVLVQGNNLTDEPFVTNNGIERQAIDYQVYGKTFLFGVNYRF